MPAMASGATPLFNTDNFFRVDANKFGETEIHTILAIPEEVQMDVEFAWI